MQIYVLLLLGQTPRRAMAGSQGRWMLNSMRNWRTELRSAAAISRPQWQRREGSGRPTSSPAHTLPGRSWVRGLSSETALRLQHAVPWWLTTSSTFSLVCWSSVKLHLWSTCRIERLRPHCLSCYSVVLFRHDAVGCMCCKYFLAYSFFKYLLMKYLILN